MNLSLVPEKTAGVGETLDLVAPRLHAFIWPVMLVHMFTVQD